MKKIILTAVLVLSSFIFINQAQAFEVKVDNSVKLNKEEIADGNVYASCGDMTIDGVVNGDVVAVCKSITVNGTINGDLIAFSSDITINGEVKGSARIAGTNLNINGTIGHNVNAAGTEIKLGPNSIVNWDVLVAGVNGSFNGTINGNLHGFISAAEVAGKIGKNINLQLDDKAVGGLLITKDAVVGGTLTYSGTKEARIESPSSIVGSVTRQETKDTKNAPINVLSKLFYKLSALVLIGLVLVGLKKKGVLEVAKNIEKKWWQSALIGLAILVATPLIVFFFFLTVIGIPLALILLAVYLIALSLSVIFGAVLIGELLYKKILKKPSNIFITLIIGLIIFTLLAGLPYIGMFVSFVFIISGLGALFLTIKNHIND